MTWRLPCEVNCNSADISNRGFARWRQLFLLRTWSTVIWDGHFSGLQSVFIISYRAKGRCGLNQAYIYPISWRVPRTLCSGNDQGNEVSEEKYSKTERVLLRLLPLMSHHFSCIYFDLLHRHRAYYPLLLQFPPPPPIYYLFIQSQRFVWNKCV